MKRNLETDFLAKAMRLRDEVSGNNLYVYYIETKKNIADVMTKPLPIKHLNY